MFNVRTKLGHEDLDAALLIKTCSGNRSPASQSKFFVTLLALLACVLLLGMLVVQCFSGHCCLGRKECGSSQSTSTGKLTAAAGSGVTENGNVSTVLSLDADRQIEGKRLVSRGGREYLAFLGIPYAKPPVGSLRFQPPVEPKPWNGTLDGRNFKSWCIQKWSHNSNETTPTVGSEDCLYLNVYTPKKLAALADNTRRGQSRSNRRRSRNLLSVMVYVHGGGSTGNVNRYGADYLMDEDIVLVTFHYRLGVMGNLNTNDRFARGNQGLKDNIMAFKWIQSNIASFGGDPERVTLFGESYGAMSISAHLISPMSKGLFHRAILQSGSVLMPEIVQTKTLENSMILSKKLNCTVDNNSTNVNTSAAVDTEELVNCLQNADAESVVLKSFEPPFGDVFTISVEPSGIDDEIFLADTPLNQLARNVNPMPVIVGVTSSEFLAMSLSKNYSVFPGSSREHNTNWTQVLISELKLGSAKDPQALVTAIHDFYIGSDEITNATERNLTNMFSDRNFVHPATVIASYQLQGNNATGKGPRNGNARRGDTRRNANASSNNVYLYQFNYPVNTSYVSVLIDQFGPDYYLGVEHADDLQFLFPYGNFPYISLEHKDANFSKAMVHLWASFADTGVPDTGNAPAWTPCSQKPYNWYELDADPRMITTENGLADRMSFWDSLDLTELYL